VDSDSTRVTECSIACRRCRKLALVDVLDYADEIEREARRIAHQRYGALDPQVGAVLAPVQALRRKRRQLAPDHPVAVLGLVRSDVVGMDELVRPHARELMLRVAEHLAQPGVGAQDPVVLDGGLHDPDRSAIERRAVALLRLLARVLGDLALGDVLHDADHVLRVTRLVARRGHGSPRPHDAAVLAHETLLASRRACGAVRELRPVAGALARSRPDE
jgi:hypothetical protein